MVASQGGARVRRPLVDRLERRLRADSTPLRDEELTRPAIVLAPHPDDETLGAGGLIARKRELGVPVTVVFMTDGAGSHAHLVPAAELVARRRAEAHEACHRLGVEPSEVHFLDIADGTLDDAAEHAVELIAPHLERCGDRQLVVPHPDESPLDHRATFRVADEALRRSGTSMDGLLFAVWLWDQFPFTNPLTGLGERTSAPAIVRLAWRGRLGWGLPNELTRRVDVRPVLERKRHALAAHATQMAPQDGRSDWMTLGDVAGGDWLDRLLQPDEYYAERTLGAPLDHRTTQTQRSTV